MLRVSSVIKERECLGSYPPSFYIPCLPNDSLSIASWNLQIQMVHGVKNAPFHINTTNKSQSAHYIYLLHTRLVNPPQPLLLLCPFRLSVPVQLSPHCRLTHSPKQPCIEQRTPEVLEQIITNTLDSLSSLCLNCPCHH